MFLILNGNNFSNTKDTVYLLQKLQYSVYDAILKIAPLNMHVLYKYPQYYVRSL